MRLRVVERDQRRSLVFVGPNDLAISVLRRDAPTVLLDAGATLIAPSVERIVGYAPRLVDLDVADGAQVSRVVLATARATRKAIHGRGSIDGDAATSLLRSSLQWALEGSPDERIVIVSWRDLESLLAFCFDQPDAPTLLRQSGVSAQVAADVREKLADLLPRLAGRISTAHYGALRGLDAYRDFDALATVGDPRPPLNEEHDKAAWIGVDPDGRLNALAAAELDQAHGRLRLIHRLKPARALHVGAILPAGWRGRDVEVRRSVGGRPKTRPSTRLTPQSLREQRIANHLSLQELAARSGISKRSLINYESSKFPISEEVAGRLLVALSL